MPFARFGNKRRIDGDGNVSVAQTLPGDAFVDSKPVDRSLEVGGKGLGRAAAITRQPGKVDLSRNQRDRAYC